MIMKIFHILKEPREALRKNVLGSSYFLKWLLRISLGLLISFNLLQVYPFISKSSLVFALLVSLLLSPIIGYIFIQIGTLFLFVTGKWCKGKADYKGVEEVLTLSITPLLFSLLLWFFLILFFRGGTFYSELTLYNYEVYVILGAALLQMAVLVYYMIFVLILYSTAEEFSLIKGIISISLALFLAAMIVVMIWAILLWGWVYLLPHHAS